jgi:hypothetical protein
MASAVFPRGGHPYCNESLLVDVANSTYAIRNHITARGVRALWATLSAYVNSSLRAHKVRDWRVGGPAGAAAPAPAAPAARSARLLGSGHRR